MIIPATQAEQLLVTTWHVIKDNPETWNQSSWRCDTGYCVAGWIDTIAGGQWINEPILIAVGGTEYLAFDPAIDDDYHRRPKIMGIDGNYVITSAVSASHRAEMLLRDLADNTEGCYASVLAQLFHQDNDLEDIRARMIDLLGYDPDDALPDENFLLGAKRELARAESEGGFVPGAEE